jgi:ABC-type lipoprotein export system ATPase subunit
MPDPIITCSGLRRTFRMGDTDVHVLKGVDFTVHRGEFIAIEGRSGSGKSTLLHLLAGLDAPQQGTIIVQGDDVAELAERAERAVGESRIGLVRRFIRAVRLIFPFIGDAAGEKLARIRNRNFGFVFQFYHLLPELNVLDNAMISSQIGADAPAKHVSRDRATAVLTQLGLGQRLHHRPSQLSGGERQRVAIARALMNQPQILFADEPTGNLDTETGAQIMKVLEDLHAKGQTIVMVTHDRTIARRADRTLIMRDGRLDEA